MDHTLHELYPLTRIVLDTQYLWLTAEDAVGYVATNHLNATTSLAMQSGILLQSGFLADWIVGQRIFAQYMTNGCIPDTSNNALLKSIVATAPWSQPVRVYGYNSMDVVFGGDLFEAETDCIDVLGQIASAHCNNFAFWSRVSPVTAPLEQAPRPAPPTAFNHSKTYIALIYGDMDNLDFVRSFGRQVRSAVYYII